MNEQESQAEIRENLHALSTAYQRVASIQHAPDGARDLLVELLAKMSALTKSLSGGKQ